MKRLLPIVIAGALLAGCGEDKDEGGAGAGKAAGHAEKAEQAKKPTTPAATEPDVPDEPAGPSEREIAIDYSIRMRRIDKKYRAESKRLIKGFKKADTPAELISVSKRYKRFLNQVAHSLAIMDPPRSIRTYHARFIVLMRRENGHMSIGIGAVKQLNLNKFRRFETLIDRDIKKAEKAWDVIDNRMERLLDG